MLIKELRISDFLVFPGEQRIQLPTEKDHNLVVVLAPNNAGKTNIIRALKFFFYGHLPDCTETTAYRLIHDGARAAAAVGSEIRGWVEVTLELDEQELTLRRTVKARKRGNDQWMPPELVFTKVIRNPKLHLLLDSDGIYQTKLRTMVPERLFDAFYFRGEPLDGKLLGGVTAIRESLASFLHEDRWREAEAAAEAVRQAYTRELGRLSEKNEEYHKLLSNEELFRSHILAEQKKLEAKKEQLEDVTVKFHDVTNHLQELGSGGDGERLVSQLRDLRTKLENARRTRERGDADIARLVGASRGIPFLLPALPTAIKVLRQMQEDNIIPADVSERFVNRILSSPSCVCGRAHNNQTRLAWTQYKEKTLSVDLNRGLSDLLNAVQDSNSQSYTRLAAELTTKLKDAQAARSRALTDIEQFNAAVSDIEGKLQASPIEEIRALTQKLRELASSRERLRSFQSR